MLCHTHRVWLNRFYCLLTDPKKGLEGEMILCSHAVVGAALASLMPSRPLTAFVVGFASHFALDAIPHADYPIRSRSVDPNVGAPMVLDKALLWDALAIGSDGLFGIMAAVFLFGSPVALWAVLLGAIGAMLPDPLQFVYTRFPHEPLRTLQRFHRWAHTDRQIQGAITAVSTQAAFVFAVVWVAAAIDHGPFAAALAMAH
jgi:hypothetical protein